MIGFFYIRPLAKLTDTSNKRVIKLLELVAKPAKYENMLE